MAEQIGGYEEPGMSDAEAEGLIRMYEAQWVSPAYLPSGRPDGRME